MSNKKSIEESIKMWKWLEEKGFDNKITYFYENNIKEIPHTQCYLCHEIKNSNGQINCDKCCFSVFKSCTNEFFCMELNTPYDEWCNCRSMETRRIAASKMVNFLIECLDELEEADLFLDEAVCQVMQLAT